MLLFVDLISKSWKLSAQQTVFCPHLVCSTTLWVGQVDKKATQQDLTNLFEEFGQIESINVSRLCYPADSVTSVALFSHDHLVWHVPTIVVPKLYQYYCFLCPIIFASLTLCHSPFSDCVLVISPSRSLCNIVFLCLSR